MKQKTIWRCRILMRRMIFWRFKNLSLKSALTPLAPIWVRSYRLSNFLKLPTSDINPNPFRVGIIDPPGPGQNEHKLCAWSSNDERTRRCVIFFRKYFWNFVKKKFRQKVLFLLLSFSLSDKKIFLRFLCVESEMGSKGISIKLAVPKGTCSFWHSTSLIKYSAVCWHPANYISSALFDQYWRCKRRTCRKKCNF